MPVTEFYAFNLICENLLAALYGVALNQAKIADLLIDKATKMCYNYIVISSLKTALAISY